MKAAGCQLNSTDVSISRVVLYLHVSSCYQITTSPWNLFCTSSRFTVDFTSSMVAFPSPSGGEVAVATAIAHCGGYIPSAFLLQPNNVLRNYLILLFPSQAFWPSLPIRRLSRNLFLGFDLACAPHARLGRFGSHPHALHTLWSLLRVSFESQKSRKK